MRITMIDEGVAFDGASPDARPLGGAEKAFARLAQALGARGHEVSAITKSDSQAIVETVAWLPWDAPRPPETDLLVAWRKPHLLDAVAESQSRCLYLWDPASSLADEAARAKIAQHRPTLVFTGAAHGRGLKNEALRRRIVTPGVADVYRLVAAAEPTPPVCIVTTHPQHGLLPMLRLWRTRIHPARPEAELHIYSAGLARALATGNAPGAQQSALMDLAAEVSDAKADGVSVRPPLADPGMAEAYGAARLHLYPVIAREMYASTLAESQAAGLPALIHAGAGASAQLLERVKNGMTGYFAPDDDAFVNLATSMLAPESPVARNLAAEARAQQRSRGWADAAIEFESLWT